MRLKVIIEAELKVDAEFYDPPVKNSAEAARKEMEFYKKDGCNVGSLLDSAKIKKVNIIGL